MRASLRAATTVLLVALVCMLLLTDYQRKKSMEDLAAMTQARDFERKQRTSVEERLARDEARLEGTSPSCFGFNCDGLFTSEAAGVMATTYVYYEMSFPQLEDFCRSDQRVNQWSGYKDAVLMEFSTIDASSKAQPNLHIVQCGWRIPSKIWCRQ